MSTSTHLDAAAVAGPMLMSFILNWIFFGVLSVQVYLYFLAFNDRAYIKVAVYVTYFLECVQIILFTYAAFKTFVIQFASCLAVFDEVGTLWLSVPVISGLIGYISQSLYAYRLSVLADSKYIAAVIAIFSLCQLALTFGLAFEAKKQRQFSQLFETRALIVTVIWGCGSAICDLFIASSMIYCLRRWDLEAIKNSRTHEIVWKVIRLTVETGSLTALIAILSVIFLSLPVRPAYYQTCIGIIGKAYSNSAMIILNSRITISVPSHYLASNSEERLPRGESEEGLDFACVGTSTKASAAYTAMDSNISTPTAD